MKENEYPNGWDAARMQRLLVHYEEQTEDEALLEDEAAFANRTQTMMGIPLELVPAVRELVAKYDSDQTVPA